MTEEIRDIAGYEGRYQVTSLGRILSMPNGSRSGIRELKVDLTKSRNAFYARVSLCNEGVIERIGVHRLVCSAFHDNPENKPQVNHIDNNTLHNEKSNLEWSTPIENWEHSAKQGRQKDVQLAGTAAAAKANEKRSLENLVHILGSRLLHVELKPTKTRTRRYVTYRCKYCRGVHITRMDSIYMQKGGVCPSCLKDEDIVLTA